MYYQERNGKYRFFETYIDPLTNKRRITSVALDRNTAQSRKRAQALLSARIRELTAKTDKYSSASLKSLIAAYIAFKRAHAQPQTVVGDEKALKAVARILGEDTDINMIDARFVIERIDRTGESNTTKNYRLKTIKKLFRWAYQYDYIKDGGWVTKLQKYKDNEKARRELKYLEPNELQLLLNSIKIEKYKNLTAFLALTGMRVGEALAITENDFDLSRRTIRINKTLSLVTYEIGQPKTDSSNRTIHIQNELMPLVEKILPDCFKNVQYFSYNKFLKETTTRVIGRSLSPHSLRHTHVSLLAEAGAPLSLISERCGHHDSDVTRDIYLHVTQRTKDRNAAFLDSVTLL